MYAPMSNFFKEDLFHMHRIFVYRQTNCAERESLLGVHKRFRRTIPLELIVSNKIKKEITLRPVQEK